MFKTKNQPKWLSYEQNKNKGSNTTLKVISINTQKKPVRNEGLND